MRYNLHIFFTVKIQKFTPYAPFLPPVFIIDKTPFLSIIKELKGTIINKMAFLTIMRHDSFFLLFKKTLF